MLGYFYAPGNFMPTRRHAIPGLLIAAAIGAAPASAAEPFTMQSDPGAMARKVLGERKGVAAVGLWRDGAAVYGKAEKGTAANPAPLFEIGSISKVFTGLLLAQAVERGELALDDNLGKLLKGQANLAPEVAAITLRQLVTHSSCLPRMPANFTPDNSLHNPYASYERPALWAALTELKLPHAPPCEPVYSNMGFGLAGELLSLRYAKPWETLVRERITGPLGMRDTVQYLGDKAARLAPAYSGAEPTSQWDFTALSGAGALRSTPADMLLFSRAILAGKDGPLGAAVPRLLQPLGTFDGVEIGYGIMMRGPAGKRVYSHAGGTGGFRADWLLIPDARQALIVLASNNEAPVDIVAGDVLLPRFKIASGHIAPDAVKLPDYAGVYRVDSKMAFTFVAQGQQLFGRISGQPFAALTPAATDVFTFPTVGAEFTFARESGKVVASTLRQRGMQLKARRVDEAAPAAAFDPALTQAAIGGEYVVAEPALPVMHFEVRAHDGQLLVRLNDQPMLPVFPVPGKPDRYASDVVAAEFQFERDTEKRPSAMTLYQNGRSMRALRKAAVPMKLDGVAFYVRGSMNDWGVRDQLKPAGPNLYQATLALAKGEYQFKLASEDWKAVDLGGSAAEPLAAGKPGTLHQLGANLTLSVASAARYVFTVDASAPGQPRLLVKAE
jgi:D-alanyl-D-alanine-carboxypeptidase/D-alanyl-D-alanine-endopeptidase